MESSASSSKKKAPKGSKPAKAKQGSKLSKKTAKASDKLDKPDKVDKTPSTPNPKDKAAKHDKNDKPINGSAKESAEREKEHPESAAKLTEKGKEKEPEKEGESDVDGDDSKKKNSDDGDVKMLIQIHEPENKTPTIKKPAGGGLLEMYTSMMTSTTTAAHITEQTPSSTQLSLGVTEVVSKSDKSDKKEKDRSQEKEKNSTKSNGNGKATVSKQGGAKNGKSLEPGNANSNSNSSDDDDSSDSDGNAGDHSSDSDWTDDERKGIIRKRKRSIPGPGSGGSASEKTRSRSKKSSKRSKIGTGTSSATASVTTSRLSLTKNSSSNTQPQTQAPFSTKSGSGSGSGSGSVGPGALPQFSISFAANSMPPKSIFESEVDESVKKCITDHLNKTVSNAMRIFEQKITGIQPQDFEGKDSDVAMLPRATTAYVQSVERYIETLEQIFSHWNKFSSKVNPIVLLYDLYQTVKYDEDATRIKIQTLCMKMLRYFMNTPSVNDTNAHYLELVRTVLKGNIVSF